MHSGPAPELPLLQVRGVSSTLEELEYIMQHSGSSALVVQDAATLDKLLPAMAPRAPGEPGECSVRLLVGGGWGCFCVPHVLV